VAATFGTTDLAAIARQFSPTSAARRACQRHLALAMNDAAGQRRLAPANPALAMATSSDDRGCNPSLCFGAPATPDDLKIASPTRSLADLKSGVDADAAATPQQPPNLAGPFTDVCQSGPQPPPSDRRQPAANARDIAPRISIIASAGRGLIRQRRASDQSAGWHGRRRRSRHAAGFPSVGLIESWHSHRSG
jgi:hypothetical protein